MSSRSKNWTGVPIPIQLYAMKGSNQYFIQFITYMTSIQISPSFSMLSVYTECVCTVSLWNNAKCLIRFPFWYVLCGHTWQWNCGSLPHSKRTWFRKEPFHLYFFPHFGHMYRGGNESWGGLPLVTMTDDGGSTSLSSPAASPFSIT
jgi:hypothetical protein